MKNNVLKIAHRGALTSAPENTLMAFEDALAAGVDMIELDIRICKTGEPIVIHDPTLNRTTNGRGKVVNHTLEQIKSLKVHGAGSIPTLAEVIEKLGGKIILNLDIKTRQSARPTVELLRKYINKKVISYDDLILASANVLTLRTIFGIDKRFRLSVIIRYLPKLVTRYTLRFQPFSVQPLQKITTQKFVEQLHEKGIKVFPWALKTTEDGIQFIEKMRKAGPDGIISFFPEKIKNKEEKHLQK